MNHISEEVFKNLNFLRVPEHYIFRKFYRSGLRSHIFEIVEKTDVQKERTGEMIDGIRHFPKAVPVKMLRLLRNRFGSIEEVYKEVDKYNLLLHHIGKERIASSEEFIVEYTGTGRNQIMLCGLQEYVRGDILDPWRIYGTRYLHDLYAAILPPKEAEQAGSRAFSAIKEFIQKIRLMITRSGFIPDLAGIGNLILTPEGGVKLVDINNIVPFRMEKEIPIDDKGFPSCDVSVEVLVIIEQMILKQNTIQQDPLFRHFLNQERRRSVRLLQKQFYNSLS